MASIFLSYSRADRPKAQVVAEALTAEGFSVWWDKVLRAGQTYDEVTEGMLRDADVVVVLWSTVSVKSKWVRAEATLGQRTSVLIPAMIEEAERPIMFELTQSADLVGWGGDRNDPRWKEFVIDIRRAAEHAKPAVAAPVPPPAPGQAADMTMELTFWSSVKDSGDKADFEAYLKRYPDGHYSDLARNRIAAMSRAEAKAAAPLPPPPATSPPPPPPPAPPPPAAPKPVVAAAPAPPKSAPPRPQPAPAKAATPPPKKKSGSSVPVMVGGLASIIIAGWALSMVLPGQDDSNAGSDSEQAATTEASLSAPPEPELPIIEIASAETSDAAPEQPVEAPAEPAAPPAPVCEVCPAMVAVSAGKFQMGSPATEAGREPIEGPVHEVTVKSFWISKSEITHAQWMACVEGGGCNGHRPGAPSSDAMPVAAISWRDATAYTTWLSEETGRTYRLPTEAEWEYAARGGTSTAYWWGDRFDAAKAPRDKIRDAASLPENPFGLQGMLGNVGEWTQDCYVNGYTDAPADGSAVTSGDCSRRVVRGGSIKSNPSAHRAANRARLSVTTRDRQYGFRVVLTEE
jgi:formylglycine-generating enzyme required for sulfatase activity